MPLFSKTDACTLLADPQGPVSQDLSPLMERRRTPIEGPLALSFSKLTTAHLSLAGAKAVNLARVSNELDIPAANGFAVTTAAFDLFLRQNRLMEPIDAMLARFDPDRHSSGSMAQDQGKGGGKGDYSRSGWSTLSSVHRSAPGFRICGALEQGRHHSLFPEAGNGRCLVLSGTGETRRPNT